MNIFDNPLPEPSEIHPNVFTALDKPNWSTVLNDPADLCFMTMGMSTARSVLAFLKAPSEQLTYYCVELGKFTFEKSQEYDGTQRDDLLLASVDLQFTRALDESMQDDRALQIVSLATLQCAFACICSVTRCGELNGLATVIKDSQEAMKKFVTTLSWQTLVEQCNSVQQKHEIDIHAKSVAANLRDAMAKFAFSPMAVPINAEGEMQIFLQYTLDRYVEFFGVHTHEADSKCNPFEWMDDSFCTDSGADESLLDEDGN